MSARIDEQVWKQISTKLAEPEAIEVLREMITYTTDRLRSRMDQIKASRDAVAFFSKGKEFLTVNVTRTNLRIYFQPSSGAFFGKDEKFEVEKVSLWEGSLQKTTGKYRAMTAWISKKKHLPGMKALVDRIPTAQ